MERNLIVLADGRRIGGDIICQLKLTEKVNEGKILNPGAVCPTVLEAELLAPNGKLHIPVDSELTLYKVDEAGTQEQVGVFTVEDAVYTSPNRYLITAYDRLRWLDKDLSTWVDNLDGWPYKLQTFAQMVCDACGVHLLPGYFTNGEWPVHRFTVVNVTGSKLMRWVGELSCRFCRATPDGDISLEWYADAEEPVWEGDNKFVFLDSFSHGDYLTHAIDKIVIRADRKERGYIYGNGGNAYVITGNQLMAVVPNESFEGLARVLYEHLNPLRYTPGTVTVPAAVRVKSGDILRIRDRNSQEVLMYVMKKTQCGQKSILECTGTYRRNIPM
ncbi:MAG: hypothetical protein IJX01_07155 [Oscillospiraceae bacterium]|nr:hypothetical protein [Oscillospiraceae bacterium]